MRSGRGSRGVGVRKVPPFRSQLRGLPYGEQLVLWLNESSGTDSHERILSIKNEMESLRSQSLEILIPDDPRDLTPETGLLVERLHLRRAALNQVLANYVFHPRVWITRSHRWIFQMVPGPNEGSFTLRRGDETLTEAEAVQTVLRLAEVEDLVKIRLCAMCRRKWLFAKRGNYRFCTDECRESFYAKSPGYHERKAANQQRYRDNLKRQRKAQDRVFLKTAFETKKSRGARR